MKIILLFGQTVKLKIVKALILHKHFPILVGMLMFCVLSNAQNVGNWTLNNTLSGTGSPTNSVGNIAAGSAVSSTAFNGGTEWYGQGGFPTGLLPDANAYLQFSISPNTGYELHLGSIIVRMRRSNTGNPSGSGPTLWCLRSSRDGYVSNIAIGTMNHNYANYTIPLAYFTMLASTITFRLYGYGVTVSSGGNNRLVLDNISIQGALFTLPLQLQAPELRATENGNINVSWRADDITAGTQLRLQRSGDGVQFETIHAVTEQTGGSAKQYSFADNNVPAGWQQVYYRIEAEEPGGATQLSRVVNVSRKMAARLNIEKVMVRGPVMQAVVQIPATGSYTIAIHSSSGILIHKQVISLNAGTQSIPVTVYKSGSGMHVMSIYDNSGIVSRPFLPR